MPSKSKKTVETKPVSDGPKPKFMHIGKGKFVHLFRTKAWDLKHSQCPQVRRANVAGKVNYKAKGLSPEAALALDTCEDCGVDAVAKRLIKEAQKPEDRKSQAEDRRNEVLERAAGKKTKKSAKHVVAKKDDKPSAPKKPSMTKAGVRSVASAKDGDPSKTKAQLLANHGQEHGWDVKVEKDEHGWVVIAKRGEETIWAPFVDGKFDETRYGTLTVGGWTGKLRAAHACRRQMSCEGRDRPFPEPGKGRSGPRRKQEDEVPEEESPQDAARRVPFMIDDDDIAIIDILRNSTIKWRNGKTNTLHEAWFPPKNGHVKIEANKDGRRYVVFDEVVAIDSKGTQYGKTLNVYLDKIIRVSTNG